MALNVTGLIAIIVFYVLILALGIWASRKSTKRAANSVEVMLAGRNIGTVIGVFTMTATWVGGGYINGTAEVIYDPASGLAWCQAPIAYSISLLLGGIFFAKKMRKRGFVTMIDPLQERLGDVMGALLFLPALIGELFWSAAILSALGLPHDSTRILLRTPDDYRRNDRSKRREGRRSMYRGTTLTVILDIGSTISIIVSAAVAISYVLVGGLRSVVYTDVLQLLCIFVGLWLSVPFAYLNDVVTSFSSATPRWIGEIKGKDAGTWLDSGLLMTFGGIPWQEYFQRCLSARSAQTAQNVSFAAAFGSLVLAAPAALIGVIGANADWNQTMYVGEVPLPKDSYKLILPMVLQYLCPPVVAFIGLGAISAAVMSSADSNMLSASSMFSRNVYKFTFRKTAGEREVVWVMRVCIVVYGILACAIAITVTSIYDLFLLASDFVYVILFPQLCCVLYFEQSNTYGSAVGYMLGLFFRLGGGEHVLHLPPFIKYIRILTKSIGKQLFPFKKLSMLISLVSLILVSWLTQKIFERGWINGKYDIFNVVGKCSKEYVVGETESNGTYNSGYCTSVSQIVDTSNQVDDQPKIKSSASLQIESSV